MFKTLNNAAIAYLIYDIPYLKFNHDHSSGESVPESMERIAQWQLIIGSRPFLF